MCGIAGIVGREASSVGRYLPELLATMRHRGPDGAGVFVGGAVFRASGLSELPVIDAPARIAMGHVRLKITGGVAGLQPIQSSDGRLTLLHNGEVYNHEEIAASLPPGDRPTTGSDSESVLRLLEREYRGDLVAAVRRVLPRLDGIYTFAITDNNTVVLVRDPIGVRQLYYLEQGDHLLFASEKKPLLHHDADGASVRRLLPGHIISVREGRRTETRFWSPHMPTAAQRYRTADAARDAYRRALLAAIQKRVARRPRVGVLFSGGVDSVLIAHLARQTGVPITCYTAGREGAPDLDWARRTADAMDFALDATTMSTEDVRTLLPDVIATIEDHSMNQVEVSLPMYASIRRAQESGERVLLTGQGADELFGGYSWYPTIVGREGYGAFEMRSWEDTFLLYKECLEREDKIAMAHSIELRVPYLDLTVIDVAFCCPPSFKIRSRHDALGKRVHRDLARDMGIPAMVADRPKEAAQHGAGIHEALAEIASAASPTEEALALSGYDTGRSVPETLGSSSRYGYRYGDPAKWKPNPVIQYYLDTVAYGVGLLPDPARWQLSRVQSRLAAQRGGTGEVRFR